MELETLLSLFFPKELTQYFELKGHREVKDSRSGAMILEMTFEEKNELPEGYNTVDYEAKDFHLFSPMQCPTQEG